MTRRPLPGSAPSKRPNERSMKLTTKARRLVSAPTRTVAMIGVLLAGLAGEVRAQVVQGGDFDIGDYLGNLSANTMHLRGREGFGTNTQAFVLVNAATSDQDVDRDGYAPGIDFRNLVVS